MNTEKKIVIIAIALVAMIVIGEVAIYGMSDRYSSSADTDSGTLNYSITARGSKEYSVIVMDNCLEPMGELYIYYDPEYPIVAEDVSVAIGASQLTVERYVQQLTTSLRIRGVSNINTINAAELGNAMVSDASSTHSKGLVVLSGALPDTVYTGSAADPIFDWLNTGGRLYWAGNLIGNYSSTAGGIVDIGDIGQGLFGVSCFSTADDDTAFQDVSTPYRDALSLMNNRIRYAVDTSLLSASEYVAAGYTDGTYSSIVSVKYGNGMVCVLGGSHSNMQRDDLAQVIASGLCYSSELVALEEGSVKRTTISSSVDISTATGNISVYVYFGGYYTVHGRTYSFIA